jgi:ABC-2 type transport system ATP-binding protein/lipopolysaccharide transport system ATP-binding protein
MPDDTYCRTANAVISLEHVKVQYRAPTERYHTFKEYAIRWLQGKVHHQTFMALNDVSLTVHRNEVFGIIGNNGAGKSTMLKLIARVLRPSSGRVCVQGRVAPLLELGAGFHPELSGRENVYLNGAMLGFSRKDMNRKFEEILAFSEIGEFIDAPLRTYSSGMMARLGFSVAMDVEPDILILDEILSVGDESFQKKCLNRIEEIKQESTILLVSHSMKQVEQMCTRVAWLDHGQVRKVGKADEVIEAYREAQSEQEPA